MENGNKVYLTSNEDVLLDPNYRYQISTLVYRSVIKKGTPITVIENLEQFCRELQFDHDELIKIIGKKLSAKSGYNKSSQYYYIQSVVPPAKINTAVYGFIQEYLLCRLCDKPEVILKHTRDNIKQNVKHAVINAI